LIACMFRPRIPNLAFKACSSILHRGKAPARARATHLGALGSSHAAPFFYGQISDLGV
jgi:hypothetical protein